MKCRTFGFAGDRQIAVRVLEFLLGEGHRPAVLLVSDRDRASHAETLRELCPHLDPERILEGRAFRRPATIDMLQGLDLDYVICVHFPYLIPQRLLSIPRHGFLNLHPAFLPFNRGWHTPSWAILDGTPYGATLHFMTDRVDAGDILMQRRVTVSPGDTANSLYQRVLDAEFEVFREAWPSLRDGTYRRVPQDPSLGTEHRRDELLAPEVQRLNLGEKTTVGDLLVRLRALTTSVLREAAYFEAEGRRYRVQVTIREEEPQV